MVYCTHDASKNCAVQGETQSGANDAICIERQDEQSCTAIGAAIVALLDALWLLVPTGGRRGSSSAVRLSARRARASPSIKACGVLSADSFVAVVVILFFSVIIVTHAHSIAV